MEATWKEQEIALRNEKTKWVSDLHEEFSKRLAFPGVYVKSQTGEPLMVTRIRAMSNRMDVTFFINRLVKGEPQEAARLIMNVDKKRCTPRSVTLRMAKGLDAKAADALWAAIDVALSQVNGFDSAYDKLVTTKEDQQ